MLENGLEPELPQAAAEQLRAISGPASDPAAAVRDLRSLLWCSIDNDDSRDLDQLSVAQPAGGQGVRILVAIADVSATVQPGSPLDAHAAVNTTSVYTAAQVFPMLPERLSTDITCLAEDQDRLGLIIEFTVAADGSIQGSQIYRALVRNRAKLAYNAVAAWLEGKGAAPPRVAALQGMSEQLRTQDEVAQQLKRMRKSAGALGLVTLEAQAVYRGTKLLDLTPDEDNRAKELIEYFMIAANGVAAQYLEQKGMASLRRVLRDPPHWDRLVELARARGASLPPAADGRALSDFLVREQTAAPTQFPELSLQVVKLLGAAEYVLKRAGEPAEGHFGLALADYSHSTAPNRRYPDLLTQRLLKAALQGEPAPYSEAELGTLAGHCTQQEGHAAKVERRVAKSAAALLLRGREGECFDAIVTGSGDDGTWVRIAHPLAEGRLAGAGRLALGTELHVRLKHTDVERGFIDFERVS